MNMPSIGGDLVAVFFFGGRLWQF